METLIRDVRDFDQSDRSALERLVGHQLRESQRLVIQQKSMPIRLTEKQWADVQKGSETPPRVSDPANSTAFVLLKAEAYERFKSLFEEDPITEQERRFQLEQFAKRAGWDDPGMDVYDDLDPRRQV